MPRKTRRPATVLWSALLVLLAQPCAHAQVGPVRPPPQPAPADTIKPPPFRVPPPVSPLGAAVRSLLLPGWGQAILGRRVTGAAFVFWEGLTLTMTVKAARQLAYQESIPADSLDGKRQELQDWAVLLAFNHLLAAAEAFVSAQLWDFPVELEVQAGEGTVGAGLRVRFDDRK